MPLVPVRVQRAPRGSPGTNPSCGVPGTNLQESNRKLRVLTTLETKTVGGDARLGGGHPRRGAPLAQSSLERGEKPNYETCYTHQGDTAAEKRGA